MLCDIKGINIEEVENETLPQVIRFSVEAGKLWREIQELRKAVPAPWSAREAFHFSSVLSQSWGSEEIVKIYRFLCQELRERVENKIGAIQEEKMRLLALHFGPYHSSDLLDLIEKQGAVIVFEEVSYPCRDLLDPNKPYESLAKQILRDGNYRDGITRGDDLVELVREYKTDGIIYFGQENCGWNKGTFHIAKRVLQETKSPILSLSTDCLLKTRTSHLKMRVQAFIESFLMRDIFSHPVICSETHSIGIDIGSTTTKIVIIDSKSTIIDYDIFLTRKNTLREFLASILQRTKISLEKREVAVTGIGRENLFFLPTYKNVSEITCHLMGATALYPDVEIVIDIGGQDMKVIFKNGKFALNNSCSAGSGQFLEKMAKTLGIDFRTLGDLDAKATKSIVMSNMCTVFAETDIVAALTLGEKMENLARTIHEMIARWVISLVMSVCSGCSGEIKSPIVMAGGVALNGGVVRAIENLLGVKIFIPKISPQIVGAYGAAIVALNNANLKFENEQISEFAHS